MSDPLPLGSAELLNELLARLDQGTTKPTDRIGYVDENGIHSISIAEYIQRCSRN